MVSKSRAGETGAEEEMEGEESWIEIKEKGKRWKKEGDRGKRKWNKRKDVKISKCMF